MIHHLAENGIMALVLPHGALFRGGAEQHIRKYLIENRNYLDAVIGLPANIFYGTSIPTCIMVFKKCKEHPEDVLFIDASQHFEKVKTQNVLREEHIDKIVETYRNRIEEDKYSKKANLQLIADNDYNLNIPRYVDTFEAEGIIDIDETCDLLKKINDLSIRNDEKIFSICNELKIPQPTGNNIFLLKQYKKGIMQKIFSQELRFKDDNGNDYPDWEEKKLGEVGDIITGKTPNTSDLELWDGNIQFVTPTDINENKYQYETQRTIKELSKTKLLPAKSIMFTCIASIGKMSLSIKPCVTNQQINSIIPNVNFNNEYIFYAVLNIVDYIKSTQSTNTLPIINKTEFSKFEINVPKDKSEQTKIANFLSAIDDKINHCGVQIEKMEVWKKGLLQQMFC
jgi:type I restriction enzyme M protein